MLIFDLTSTAINHYMDYRKDRNVMGQSNLAESRVIKVVLVMLAMAMGLGIYFVYLTDWVVLLIGIVCFFYWDFSL